MPKLVQDLINQYVSAIRNIFGKHIKQVILYGSYARGDFKPESDIDIMILVDFTDMELKAYRHQLSGLTYDFNEKHNLDIKPIAKSEVHFQKWISVYPFYQNVKREGVALYGTA